MTPRPPAPALARAAMLLCLAALASNGSVQPVSAAEVTISNTPLAYSTVTVKPNVMFILDDSGSMDSEYMPDDMDWTGFFGYYSPQCNGLAFNPNIKYEPPVKADGSSYPDASFSSAWNNGFNTGAGTSNLGDSSGIIGVTATTDWSGRVTYSYKYGARQYYLYTGSQPVMNWTYSSSGSVDTSTTFYRECNSWIDPALGTSTPGSAVFTRYLINAQDTETKQRYANWYSYYRKRLYTMRTAAGRAFASLDSNFRIGFTMISDGSVSGTNFLNVSDFDSTQKTSFYSKLYGSYAGSYTPLRGALSKIGRYYANRISGQTDPVQYSCQRNYALLSTDGYWNNQLESTTYGPYKLDGSTKVGNQDGTESRPMLDGTQTVVTETRITNVTTPTTTVGDWVTSKVYTRTNTVVQACTKSGKTGWNSYTYTERRTDTSSLTRTIVKSVLSHDTITTVTTNGVAGTPVTKTNTPASVTTPVSDTLSTTPIAATGAWSTVSTTTATTCNTFSTATTGTTYGTASLTSTTTAWGSGSPTTTSGTSDPGTDTVSSNTSTTAGDSNSLADVAEYYWANDLRTDFADNVPTNSGDPAAYQHMNTFTLGLGVRGTLAYDSSYRTATTGDFAAIKAGTKNWPVPIGTTNSGSANATHIDDLWHAAVNGRGQYFSALDPSAVSSSITSALQSIKAETGTASAAAASSLTPVSGDDWIFLPSYTTLDWTGDLRAFKYTFVDGKAVPPSNTAAGQEIWSAKTKLDARTYTDRTVYFNSGGTLRAFTYSNLSSTQKLYFDNRCTTAAELLTQCTSMNDNAKAKVTGDNILEYLKGAKTLYRNNDSGDNQVFRVRASIMGDIANAAPVYVGKPPFQYTDSGYASFATAKANRTKMVYVAANDGMLHAFKVGTSTTDTTGGTELWTFVPSAVMPNLWRLASDGFTNDHRYFVDATPVVTDVYDSTTSTWRTILVGGLGAGGRSYYALDITTPESPAVLWEITNASSNFGNLGLTYGNPIITKNKSGTWIVAFTSGLNNHLYGGNGIGRLYLADAMTGAFLSEVLTSTSDTPNNLSRIDGWVESPSNNTVVRFYGGDMLGNLWRFDHDDRLDPAGSEALLLGKAQTGDTTPKAQPITVKPLLMSLSSGSSTVPVIVFGTGRYLGSDDLTDTTTQTLYAVKDNLGATGLDVLRTGSDALVQQTLTSSRLLSAPTASVDWTSQNGWFIDLNVTTASGERVFVDPIALTSSVIQVATGITTGTSACTPSGSSWIYTFDLFTGTVKTVTQTTHMVVGMSTLINPDNTASSLINDMKGNLFSGGSQQRTGGAGSLKRSTWRELIN